MQKGFRLKATRVFGDRWKVEAETTYTEERYSAIAREDRRFTAQASVHSRVAQNIGVYLSVGYRDQNGGTFGRSYKGGAVGVGTRVAW